MSIFKCKMCGGTIEFESGATVGVCDSCGTKQTLPRLDDDRRANLYDRANHFRRNNEFDKAAGLYEQILNEDPTDAEAYWSLVLCRYGIEYVEDPATHKRVPTVNRTQFTSVFDDEDYKSALQYADGYQRTLYEEEAGTINEIQRGILEISQKEKPFDVFICYKETDAGGRRTQDSVLANDIYHQLTNEGFKVFFSRITLEDKLGTAYEPYIFAALNSAKVMVVLGTKPEYFDAVWVRNEWSRYLSIVKQSGGKKVLIPAYRDMDPYDLPEEFSHLQALDMAKLGFMQDLIRGIKKIIEAEESKVTMKEAVVARDAANVAPLLRRVIIFLEDGDWDRADDFCEQVLNQEPENAQAYLGKLMAELQVRRQEDLLNCEVPFDDSNNYRKALRFGGDKIVGMLTGYIDQINERNENVRLTGIYNNAVAVMQSALSESSFKAAEEIFRTIPGFQDSDELAEQCLERAEGCRKDSIYSSACRKMAAMTIIGYENAIDLFKTIPGWKDADEIIEKCRNKIEEINAEEEAYRSRQKRLEEERAAKDARRKRVIIIISTIISIIIGISILSYIIFLNVQKTVIIPNQKYNAALELYNAGKYDEAQVAFSALNGYKDSDAQIVKCEIAIKEGKYVRAIELYNAEKYEAAIAELEAIRGYKDSDEYIDIIRPKLKLQMIQNARVGSTVFFGSFEQDNNTSNGKEDIEWIVLARESKRILVISRYVLDFQRYNESDSNVTWESCSLRRWLNMEFLNEAFSGAEQAMIPNVTVSADKNPESDTNPGNDTTDQVFLLSISEVNEYFASDYDRQCHGTWYCFKQGASKFSEGSCLWWLRSPGYDSSRAALVYFDGGVIGNGRDVDYSDVAVRPTLWINLES